MLCRSCEDGVSISKEESAQHESKYLTRMAHDVLAMNSSLRDSAAQNSLSVIIGWGNWHGEPTYHVQTFMSV